MVTTNFLQDLRNGDISPLLNSSPNGNGGSFENHAIAADGAKPLQLFSSDSQSMPSVSAKNRNGELDASQPQLWISTCEPLVGNMKMHRDNGNCMFFALYEAMGFDEQLGMRPESGISVRNLKQQMIDMQVSELSKQCGNHELLLFTVQSMLEENELRISSTGSIGTDEEAMNKIFRAYNANSPRSSQLGADNDGLPLAKAKAAIIMAADIVSTSKNRGYTHAGQLKYASVVLRRPVLFINADSSDGSNPGKVTSFTQYNPDGTTKHYQISKDGKIFDRATGKAPVLSKDTVVIAKNPNHFYGQSSFADNNLHASVNGSKKLIRNFKDFYGQKLRILPTIFVLIIARIFFRKIQAIVPSVLSLLLNIFRRLAM
jgi:hypothetical protein